MDSLFERYQTATEDVEAAQLELAYMEQRYRRAVLARLAILNDGINVDCFPQPEVEA